MNKTFKPNEVAFLEYHLHIPGPDPLANQTTDARSRYYGDAVQGTPTIMFNGKPTEIGGGRIEAAQERYEQYTSLIGPLLERRSLQ